MVKLFNGVSPLAKKFKVYLHLLSMSAVVNLLFSLVWLGYWLVVASSIKELPSWKFHVIKCRKFKLQADQALVVIHVQQLECYLVTRDLAEGNYGNLLKKNNTLI